MKSFLKTLLSLVLLFQTSLFLVSCNDDDDGPVGEFATGVFVINEGNFSSANGSITHLGTGEPTQGIFTATNNGAVLGDVVQSMTINNDRAYIVVNNSNKVEVVNANTFESDYTIEDVALPRYFTVFNGKGYLTEWVGFELEDVGRVAVINLENGSVESTIETGIGAEYILPGLGNLYVSNSFTNTVSVIDPESTSVTVSIALSGSVSQMVVDENDKIWAISAGTTDFSVTPAVPNNDGKLIRIDPSINFVDAEIELNTNVSGRLAINSARNTLYIIKGTSVFAIPTSGISGTIEPLITQNDAIGFYGIDIEPGTDNIYVSDSRGFQGNGVVYRYTSTGELIDSFESGIGPNGFVFK